MEGIREGAIKFLDIGFSLTEKGAREDSYSFLSFAISLAESRRGKKKPERKGVSFYVLSFLW